MLLGAVLSDTVLLTSPTTSEHDRRVTTRFDELLAARGRRDLLLAASSAV